MGGVTKRGGHRWQDCQETNKSQGNAKSKTVNKTKACERKERVDRDMKE